MFLNYRRNLGVDLLKLDQRLHLMLDN